MINQNKLRLLFLLTVATGSLYAQDKGKLGTEVVNVVKPYTPEIGDAFKVKATPMLNDSVTLVKKKVTYGIFSIPVASTFAPAKGKAPEIEKTKRIKLYDNYATLGFGTYNSVLAEFYSNFEIDKNQNFGLYLNHNSSQGDIDGVVLDDKFYDTNLNLNYSNKDRYMNWRGGLDLEHQLFNWYGADLLTRQAGENDPVAIAGIDPQHSYYGAALSGSVELVDSFFNGASGSLRYFADSESSSEIRAILVPKIEFPITSEKITLNLKVDYVNGSFDRNYFNSEGIDYSHLILSGSPSLTVLRDDLTLNLGIRVAADLDTQNSETDVNFYPNVTASYRLLDEVSAYAGLEGDLEQNTYRDFTQENPFVSPTLEGISPTNQKYDLYLGIKGRLSNSLSYNVRASYLNQNNKPLYLNNPRFEDSNGNLGNQGYQYGNSFGVVYDDVKTLSFFGEINADVANNLKLRVNAEYFSYNTDDQGEAWNLPDYKVSFFADYQISQKWYTGATLFLVGERKDQTDVTGPFITPNPQTVTLESYFDANLHLGYRFNEQLSVFARGNNLLDNSYEKWLNTPVQGIQAMLGATYKFDW